MQYHITYISKRLLVSFNAFEHFTQFTNNGSPIPRKTYPVDVAARSQFEVSSTENKHLYHLKSNFTPNCLCHTIYDYINKKVERGHQTVNMLHEMPADACTDIFNETDQKPFTY